MKAFLLIVCSFFYTSTSLFAQGGGNPYNAGWVNQLDDAYQKSLKTGKPIFALYGCADCNDIRAFFASEEFYAWAENNVVLLEIHPYRYSQLSPEEQISYQSIMSNVDLAKRHLQISISIPVITAAQKQLDVDQIGMMTYFSTLKDLEVKYKEMLNITRLVK